VLPPHPTKNTRVALPRTANNFIASVFSAHLILLTTRAFADSAIVRVTADQIVAVAGRSSSPLISAAELQDVLLTMWPGPRKT